MSVLQICIFLSVSMTHCCVWAQCVDRSTCLFCRVTDLFALNSFDVSKGSVLDQKQGSTQLSQTRCPLKKQARRSYVRMAERSKALRSGRSLS